MSIEKKAQFGILRKRRFLYFLFLLFQRKCIDLNCAEKKHTCIYIYWLYNKTIEILIDKQLLICIPF